MSKAFSETEMETVRQKLIESCRACWERWGYRKTSVAQLAEMAGISTGAFYTFYPSKELLFVKTADAFAQALLDTVRRSVPTQPTKQDLAACMKLILSEVAKNPWLFSLRQDYEIFLRKIPPEFIQASYQQDLVDISALLTLFDLKPKVSMEEITAVVYTLFMSLYFTDTIGEAHHAALELLIDGVIDRLFE